ncbi:MAG: hypothetical protein GF416_02835 [Candidatus Altiarchaeales archaeon]|nr:hypothetical protein [Candidatus Altiarchaeales archaeon]MBD3416055.1 hypothetical protein [Candidatus Altiarchaeales archaeon]
MAKKHANLNVGAGGGEEGVPVARLEQPAGLKLSEEDMMGRYLIFSDEPRELAAIASGDKPNPADNIAGFLRAGQRFGFCVSPFMGYTRVEPASHPVVSSACSMRATLPSENIYSLGSVGPDPEDPSKTLVYISRPAWIPEYGPDVVEDRTVAALHALGVAKDAVVDSPRRRMLDLLDEEGCFSWVVDHNNKLAYVADMETGHPEIVMEHTKDGKRLADNFRRQRAPIEERTGKYTERFSWGSVESLEDEVSGVEVASLHVQFLGKSTYSNPYKRWTEVVDVLTRSGMPEQVRLVPPEQLKSLKGVLPGTVERGKTPNGVGIPYFPRAVSEEGYRYSQFTLPSGEHYLKIGGPLLRHDRAITAIDRAGSFEVYNDSSSQEDDGVKRGSFVNGDYDGIRDGPSHKTSNGPVGGGSMIARVPDKDNPDLILGRIARVVGRDWSKMD